MPPVEIANVHFSHAVIQPHNFISHLLCYTSVVHTSQQCNFTVFSGWTYIHTSILGLLDDNTLIPQHFTLATHKLPFCLRCLHYLIRLLSSQPWRTHGTRMYAKCTRDAYNSFIPQKMCKISQIAAGWSNHVCAASCVCNSPQRTYLL